MSSTIRIKRSGTQGSPSSLRSGELAYSWKNDLADGQRLYIGWGDETNSQADNIAVIGGKYFTDKLDHSAGTLTASSALIVDSYSKIDQFNVDDLKFDGNTISTIDNNDLILHPNGSGKIDVEGTRITNLPLTPTDDSDAASKGYVDTQISAVSTVITLSDGTSTDDYTTGNTLTFNGGTGITTSVTDDQVSFAITNTGVTADTYGSGSSYNIPVITVNQQGQITSAVDSAIPDATTSVKGVASFNSNDFSTSSGAVSIKAGGVSNSQLANSSVTVSAGDGLSGGGAVSLGSSVSLAVGVDDATIETNNDKLRVKDGGVTNAKLAFDSVTIGSTSIALGATQTEIAGLTKLTVEQLVLDSNTISSTAGKIFLDPNPVGDAGEVVVQGDLTVRGTTTTIHSTEVTISDHALVLADSALNSAQADAAGIIIGASSYSGRPTFLYNTSGDKFVSNKPIQVSNTSGLLFNGDSVNEIIDDRVSNLLLEGEAMDLTYDDGANTLTIAAETATSANLGVAKFPTANFTMTNGSVAISAIDGGTYP